jgi:hypothetical protein
MSFQLPPLEELGRAALYLDLALLAATICITAIILLKRKKGSSVFDAMFISPEEIEDGSLTKREKLIRKFKESRRSTVYDEEVVEPVVEVRRKPMNIFRREREEEDEEVILPTEENRFERTLERAVLAGLQNNSLNLSLTLNEKDIKLFDKKWTVEISTKRVSNDRLLDEPRTDEELVDSESLVGSKVVLNLDKDNPEAVRI